MNIFGILAVLSSIAVSFYYSPLLPQSVPSHWNIRGEIDAYMSKGVSLYFVPVILTIFYILMTVLPHLDPKREKYPLFRKEWNIIQGLLMVFFLYLQILMFQVAVAPATNFLQWFFVGLGLFFMSMGNYLSKVRQNHFLGIKLPWTLESEDNWNKTHRLAAWLFVAAGFVTILEGFVFWFAPGVVFGGILLASLLPMIYSFLLYKKMETKMPWVYGAILILIIAAIFLRLLSGEDDWLCQNGKWVKHGNPSQPRPLGRCK